MKFAELYKLCETTVRIPEDPGARGSTKRTFNAKEGLWRTESKTSRDSGEIRYSKDKAGKILHRITGPAERSWWYSEDMDDGCSESYYWNGKHYSEENWKQIVSYPDPADQQAAADMLDTIDNDDQYNDQPPWIEDRYPDSRSQ